MPHINRIRVNNVKYNFGTQYYDDFVMRFSCKNTIYDLANGGGKSVLMLLLLQNLIPNCTLDEKQPIEKLFRPGNDNKTIHSLIEWKLNASETKNGFEYMTTGFCARKARETGLEEEEKETASIEYFNYCILYRSFHANDILNLPLSDGKERITYSGLKNYLRDLEKKDFNLQIHIFDRKGDYQRFISEYGLYESEWEIIRGINKTEGHVRTYFETHYKTTRKVVEDLFVEEIIEKSFQNRMRTGDETEIAQTLLDIKDKLVELSKKKSQMAHYDSQMEVLDGFCGRLHALEGIFEKRAELEEGLVKNYHTAKHRRSRKEEQLQALGEEMERLTGQLTIGAGELEAAKLQMEEQLLISLERETNRLSVEVDKQEAEYAAFEKELHEREAANDFLDYLENKKQLSIHKMALDELMNRNENSLESLYTLAYTAKEYYRVEKEALTEELSTLQSTIQTKEQALQKISEETLETERNLAVAEHSKGKLSDRIELLTGKLEELRRQMEIFVVGDMKQELLENKEEQEKSENELLKLQEELAKLSETITEEAGNEAREEEAFARSEQELQERKTRLESFEKMTKRVTQLQEVYAQTDPEELYDKILTSFRDNINKQTKQAEAILKIEAFCRNCEEDKPFVDSPETRQLLAYIRRHYDADAMTGVEYLTGMDSAAKQMNLEKFPILPYAIILSRHFMDISVDEKIQSMDCGNGLIPFVEKEILEQEELLYRPERLGFVLKNHEVFYDQSLFEKSASESKRNLEVERAKLARLEDGEKVLREDLLLLDQYRKLARTEIPAIKKRVEELKANILGYGKNQDIARALRVENKERERRLRDDLNTQKERRELLLEKQRNLTKLSNLYQELNEAEKQRSAGRTMEENLQKELEKQQSLQKELSEAVREAGEIRQNIDRRLFQIENRLAEYEPYITGKTNQNLALREEEFETEFFGKKQAFEQKNADVSDKQKLVESYENAVKKSLAAMEYQGTTLETMQALYEAHRVNRTDVKQLLEEKKILETKRKELANRTHERSDKQSMMSRQQGVILHGKKLYEEKYGTYERRNLEEEQLKLFVEERADRLAQQKQEMSELQKKIKETEQLGYALEAMVSEILHMMENCNIKPDKYTGLLEEGASLKENYLSVRKEYEAVAKQEQKRRDEFQKEKAQLMDTLKLLKAYDLAQEIERSILSPKNGDEVQQYITNLEKTIDCIRLEKEHISRGIENMEVIKDNFENQCLQTCSSIKTALEKLPGLSVIRLDEKPVSMISLQIPYIREELFKESMSHYIDNIVERTESFATPAERLKYIRSQLAWKRLFSVIVKDMDKIKLQLYKRERMKEQSRYLKYEEAVGSTGQSQGIYIQFLVAVINYISSMNSRSTEAALLKKVIFIDNPFGAAKDTYIWEPIFKLLHSNNVQLIVPARGATPAITGRFEVNYILGQKLVNGKQQTVVVDYRSQVKSEALEYKELSFEQTSLF